MITDQLMGGKGDILAPFLGRANPSEGRKEY